MARVKRKGWANVKPIRASLIGIMAVMSVEIERKQALGRVHTDKGAIDELEWSSTLLDLLSSAASNL